MSELLEPFAMGSVHTADKCPFCPAKKNDEHYKTYGGADNNGTKLGNLIDDPRKFGTSTEADARPKDGAVGKDGKQNQPFLDTGDEKLANVKGTDTHWQFQAHHAISGNQCLKGDPVEKYLKEDGHVKFDTGYSVNNPQNGIWLPSFPETGTAWPKDAADKFALAKTAMKKFKRQFHLGHHNIDVDVDGMDSETDNNYVEYVKGHLEALTKILDKWKAHCPEEQEEKKHLGNPRIHAALDKISEHITKKLRGAPGTWIIFVSRHARDFTIKTRSPRTKLDFEK